MLNMSISNFNSLIKGKGNKGNTIFFFKNTLPSFLNWLPDYIIYLPHCLGILLMLYAVMQRGSPESLENMIRGILILSAIFLYSEFCYFCIWVKYFIIKNKINLQMHMQKLSLCQKILIYRNRKLNKI